MTSMLKDIQTLCRVYLNIDVTDKFKIIVFLSKFSFYINQLTISLYGKNFGAFYDNNCSNKILMFQYFFLFLTISIALGSVSVII